MSSTVFSHCDVSLFSQTLSAWYLQNHRRLPWRESRDPYYILVSEIMLQQTQVERVKAFFCSWIRRFPTLASLAQASESDVLACWQGLGYYSRARNLQKTAQILCDMGYATVPANPDLLRSLPGVGAYTLGAVCSIAFDLPIPAVDGNVRRLFSRLMNLDMDVSKSSGSRTITQAVSEILASGVPAVLSQAFMELGAVVCLPGERFLCAGCPVRDFCLACKHCTQSLRPVVPARKAVKCRQAAGLLLIAPTGDVLLQKRPAKGLWASFLEIPWEIAEESEAAGEAFQRLAARLGIPEKDCCNENLAESMKFTTWNITLHLWSCRLSERSLPSFITIPDDSFSSIAMAAGMKRLLCRWNQLRILSHPR